MIISTEFKPTHNKNLKENGNQRTPPDRRTARQAAKAHSWVGGPSLSQQDRTHSWQPHSCPRDLTPTSTFPAGEDTGWTARAPDPMARSPGKLLLCYCQ